MSQPNGVEFATTPLLSTGVRLHYAERGDPAGEAIIFLHGYSPCSPQSTMPSRSPSVDTETQINRSAATGWRTSPPTSMRSWTRSG